MIQLLPQLNILLAYQPVDFRKGIDGLIGLCRAQFDAELYYGTLFVFRNRRGTALKILTFDGVGKSKIAACSRCPIGSIIPFIKGTSERLDRRGGVTVLTYSLRERFS